MNFAIFWSWQSDAPDRCNRRFIREALDIAISEISGQNNVVESPRIETGMENTAGTPDVAQTMFDKINRSDMVLCDVSLVGSIPVLKRDGTSKKVPNPNVMVEMGYGAGRVGWNRVICVMNKFYGEQSELPFDVKSKRHPIDYMLEPDDRGNAERIKRDLAGWLKVAIDTCIKEEHQIVIDALEKLDVMCLCVVSIYRNAEYFHDLSQNQKTAHDLREIIDVSSFRTVVHRLLDLGLLRCDARGDQYAYHWTYRGRCLLEELRARNAFQEPPSPQFSLPEA